ncbi:hypothetical protein L2E82_31817 [Cichorium intybus]|uniref:Uncharacterized protein n=1 Tax=Cichorium intybus TaxID=13427 RepID=A0ACB9BFI3_CICIN|nr:hypothetical protein L2E82_31817 [Cichorium intybus]
MMLQKAWTLGVGGHVLHCASHSNSRNKVTHSSRNSKKKKIDDYRYKYKISREKLKKYREKQSVYIETDTQVQFFRFIDSKFVAFVFCFAIFIGMLSSSKP